MKRAAPPRARPVRARRASASPPIAPVRAVPRAAPRPPPPAWRTELVQATKVGAVLGAAAGGTIALREGLRELVAGRRSGRQVAAEVAKATAVSGLDGSVKGAAVIGLREVVVRVAPRFARGLVGQTAVTAAAIVGVDLAKDALKLRRGELGREEFKQRAAASAMTAGAALAAGALVSAAVSAIAAPAVGAALAIGASVAAGLAVEDVLARRPPPPA